MVGLTPQEANPYIEAPHGRWSRPQTMTWWGVDWDLPLLPAWKGLVGRRALLAGHAVGPRLLAGRVVGPRLLAGRAVGPRLLAGRTVGPRLLAGRAVGPRGLLLRLQPWGPLGVNWQGQGGGDAQVKARCAPGAFLTITQGRWAWRSLHWRVGAATSAPGSCPLSSCSFRHSQGKTNPTSPCGARTLWHKGGN